MTPKPCGGTLSGWKGGSRNEGDAFSGWGRGAGGGGIRADFGGVPVGWPVKTGRDLEPLWLSWLYCGIAIVMTLGGGYVCLWLVWRAFR
jgi:hypothetical protein